MADKSSNIFALCNIRNEADLAQVTVPMLTTMCVIGFLITAACYLSGDASIHSFALVAGVGSAVCGVLAGICALGLRFSKP